jgi:hypothetical protein
MRKIILFVSLCVAAGAAQAQIKCWNEGGKRVCGDAPPAGAKTTTIQGTTSQPAAPAQAPGAKDGKAGPARKGPLTPAEQEQEYRKRQQESQKNAEKAEAERKDAAIKRDNCERSKEALRGLESGQRMSRTDAKGERYFLDEAQTAQEVAKARQSVKEFCG